MVSLKIDRKRLLRDIGEGDASDLNDRIASFGVEVEESTPEQLVVDITPNRPDLLSHEGLSRALGAFFDRRPGLRQYPTTPSKLKVTVDESLDGIRPHTACAIVTGLDLDEAKLQEIIDMQERLHITFCRRRKRAAIGIYPLDAISGNITFTAKRPQDIVFRPLDGKREMTATEIIATHPKGKEFAPLLLALPLYPVFLDAKGKVLSMPPIINSHEVGKVTVATKEVFIESSGLDQRVCEEVVRIICCAFADMGGQVKTVVVQQGKRQIVTPDLAPRKQEFYGYYVERRLGVRIKTEQYPQLLARMGLGHEPGRVKDTHRAIIPAYRVDFLHQVDVVEDIAIAIGYDNIPATRPSLVTEASEAPSCVLVAAVRRLLIGHGLMEAKSYHLTQGTLQTAIGEPAAVRLLSSVSAEHDTLRRSLLPSMLTTLRANASHPYPQGFFEIGTAFVPASRSVTERTIVCIALAGEGHADYTRVRRIAQNVLGAFGLSPVAAEHDDARLMRGRSASLGGGLAIVGEVAPSAIAAAGIVVPVAIAEIDLDRLLQALRSL